MLSAVKGAPTGSLYEAERDTVGIRYPLGYCSPVGHITYKWSFSKSSDEMH